MYSLTKDSYGPNQTSTPSVAVQKSACNSYIQSVAMFGLLLLGTGTSYIAERIPYWRDHVQGRVPFVVEKQGEQPAPNSVDMRMPVAHLENIKSNLLTSVSDISAALGVTRQSIYKWSAGSAFPDADHLAKLRQLSSIADEFKAAGIENASSLVKMKMFEGNSLVDLLKNHKDTKDAVSILIAESKIMEKAYEQSKIGYSKAKPDNSWQSDVSLPGGIG